jgi:hypothetical protein
MAFKFSKSQKTTAARWVAIHTLGTGDGVRTDFDLPASEKPLLVLAGFYRINDERKEKDDDGRSTKVTMKATVTPGKVSFENPVSPGTIVTALELDAEGETALKMLPASIGITEALQKAVDDRRKDLKLKSVDDLPWLELYRLNFIKLVVDWAGMVDSDTNEPMPCNDETKKLFLDLYDGGIFGAFVMHASGELRSLIFTERETLTKN